MNDVIYVWRRKYEQIWYIGMSDIDFMPISDILILSMRLISDSDKTMTNICSSYPPKLILGHIAYLPLWN